MCCLKPCVINEETTINMFKPLCLCNNRCVKTRIMHTICVYLLSGVRTPTLPRAGVVWAGATTCIAVALHAGGAQTETCLVS